MPDQMFDDHSVCRGRKWQQQSTDLQQTDDLASADCAACRRQIFTAQRVAMQENADAWRLCSKRFWGHSFCRQRCRGRVGGRLCFR